jgi:SAM-dependent methyltransferase
MTSTAPTLAQTSPTIVNVNRLFYDALWRKARCERPEAFNTWPLVSELLPFAPARLEIGPGLRPRLPIAGTHFIDISTPAIEQLNARGGIGTLTEIATLPFRNEEFDLVCAFDVIEHVEDDQRVFGEVSRVLKDDGILICSVPLYAKHWTAFDDWVGHVRRYEPAELLALMARHQLIVEQSATFGMQPSNPRWVERGRWWLEHYPKWAMFWYNWVGMPLAMRFQPRLTLVRGFINSPGVDEVVLICRRASRTPAAPPPPPASR